MQINPLRFTAAIPFNAQLKALSSPTVELGTPSN
jgi:hypothetical protein